MPRNRKIERAVYASSVADIKRALKFSSLLPSPPAGEGGPAPAGGWGLKWPGAGYARIYFGAEFCQWRLPSPKTLSNAISAAQKNGPAFTLLTPWVTDAGINKLKKLFQILKDEAPGSEVVINDMGALVLLKEDFPGLTPLLGRVLVRQKRCPRVPKIMDSLPPEGREVYMRTGAEDPLSAKLLRKYGIKRIELDYPLQGLNTELGAARLKASLYTPYACVTLTRHCPASVTASEGWQSFTGCKIKGCNKNVLELKNPAHDEPLLMRGNAQFVMNAGLPETLPDGVDRIVYMERVP